MEDEARWRGGTGKADCFLCDLAAGRVGNSRRGQRIGERVRCASDFAAATKSATKALHLDVQDAEVHALLAAAIAGEDKPAAAAQDLGLQISAIEALGEIGDTRAEGVLLKLIRESANPNIRYVAVLALKSCGTRGSLQEFHGAAAGFVRQNQQKLPTAARTQENFRQPEFREQRSRQHLAYQRNPLRPASQQFLTTS